MLKFFLCLIIFWVFQSQIFCKRNEVYRSVSNTFLAENMPYNQYALKPELTVPSVVIKCQEIFIKKHRRMREILFQKSLAFYRLYLNCTSQCTFLSNYQEIRPTILDSSKSFVCFLSF